MVKGMIFKRNALARKTSFLFVASIFVLGLAACEDSDSANSGNTDFRTQLNLPESLTGTNVTASSKPGSEHFLARGVDNFSNTNQSNSEQELFSCAYLGPEDDDIFKNGYNMTKFMTSAVATWLCIGDSLIVVSNILPRDGVVRETEHDGDDASYDPDEPTHYKIVEQDDGTVEVSLYYGFSHAQDLPVNAEIGFYFVWKETDAGTTGKMIIDAQAVNNAASDDSDPVKTRMDFDYNTNAKLADMYMIFDSNNEWADGFRIQVNKNLNANVDEHVFTAIGKMSMIKQFDSTGALESIVASVQPFFDVYTVANEAGDGAAKAQFSDLAFPLVIDANDHLGSYLADKVDVYFFDKNNDPEFIDKSFTNSEFKDNRNLNDILITDVDNFLVTEGASISSTYFDSNCITADDNCDTFLDALFEVGEYDQEGNFGTDPNDWRTSALASAAFLDSVFPSGASSWDGVFDTTP